MSKDFQWESRTPPALIDVVFHLRKRWEDGEWKISHLTQNLLFAALHPSVPVGNLAEFQLAFEYFKPIAGNHSIEVFNLLLRNGTAPALFHAYYDLRKRLLEREAEGIFLELCSLGAAQTDVLNEEPIAWARAHMYHLLEDETFQTPSWIKRCCDVQGYNAGADDDEEIYWRSWRAPLLLVMKPSRSMAYDPENIWHRADEDQTTRWLEAFRNEVVLRISTRLERISGAIRLESAKRGTPSKTSEHGGKATSVETVIRDRPAEVTFSPDFHSLLLFGKQITLTARQATIVRILYAALEEGHPDVAKATLLGALEAETSNVRDFFRKTPLWKTVICLGSRRGTYRLNVRPARVDEPSTN